MLIPTQSPERPRCVASDEPVGVGQRADQLGDGAAVSHVAEGDADVAGETGSSGARFRRYLRVERDRPNTRLARRWEMPYCSPK